jgi:outer membrane protein assembly factor BamB
MKLYASKGVIALFALVVLLSGCTSLTDLKSDVSERFFGAEDPDPPLELTDIAKPTATAKVLWQSKIGPADQYDFSPTLDKDAVYAASADGSIAKFEAATGKQIWRVSAGESLSGGVGAGENLVLVGSPKGFVIALDQSGKILWKSKVSSEVFSAPKVNSGVVVVRSGDSRIFGLNAADGKRIWVYERANPALALRSSAGLIIANDIAYVGFSGGKLVALSAADGKVQWEASVAQPKGTTEIERIADITSDPVVSARLVYAVAFQGRVAAIDRTNGRVVWNRDISSYTGMNVDESRVYVTHSKGATYALDDTSGKSFWRQGGLTNRRLTAPLPLGTTIAFGDVEGYVHFLSRDDGSFATRVKTDGSPIMPRMLEIGSGSLLAQSRDGGLYAISVK